METSERPADGDAHAGTGIPIGDIDSSNPTGHVQMATTADGLPRHTLEEITNLGSGLYLTEAQITDENDESIRLGFSRSPERFSEGISPYDPPLPSDLVFPILKVWMHTGSNGSPLRKSIRLFFSLARSESDQRGGRVLYVYLDVTPAVWAKIQRNPLPATVSDDEPSHEAGPVGAERRSAAPQRVRETRRAARKANATIRATSETAEQKFTGMIEHV